MKPRPKGADGFQKREISGFELSGVFHKPACLCLAVRCGSRSVSPKVVRAPGFEPRPLGDGAAARPRWFPIRRAGPAPRASTLLRPASRRVFPGLLPPLDSQAEQPVTVIHVFDASRRRPVGLKDLGSLPQVANEVHPAHSAPNQECFERALRRIPGQLPAHEVAVPGALLVGTLTKYSKCGVTRMEIGQLAD